MPLENGQSSFATKDRKYDRQLRIWGAHGQALLESSKVCLLRCGPTGSETLKNLVLGGIAAFTVVDDAKVGPWTELTSLAAFAAESAPIPPQTRLLRS